MFFTTRDPFTFTETVVYYHKGVDVDGKRVPAAPSVEDSEYDVLTPATNVFPLGYPTEQYLCWVKNDVQRAFQKLKEEKKQALAAMKRELFEGTATAGQAQQPVSDADPGILAEHKKIVEQDYRMHSSLHPVQVHTFARIKDVQYNSLRLMFKDSSNLVIRPEVKSLKPASAVKKEEDGSVDISRPLVRKTAFGYNPALERRISYRLTQVENKKGHKESIFVNVNYLVVDPVFETAYRCDVRRVETSEKMAIKPADEFLREEEFCNVTTPFAMAKQIMLQKKFETLFTVKLQGDEDHAVERDTKIFELERHRIKHAKLPDTLVGKALEETFDGKEFLQMIEGPFYRLVSQQGPREDDFLAMGAKDLIDTANASNLRILLIGMPRCGKTTLARELEQKLKVLRISPDVWIEALFAKIKDREENPPEEEPEPELEEGQEPPPKKSWLQPLEEQVLEALKAGAAPSNAQIDAILAEMIASPAARTRGFVLDLTFTKEMSDVATWCTRIADADMLAGASFTHVVELLMSETDVKQRCEALLSTPADGLVFSAWERAERNKPKPPLGEDEEEPEEDENAPKPLVEAEMVTRACDRLDVITEQIQNYKNNERPDFDSAIVKMFHSTFIQVEVAGLTPEELTAAVAARIHPFDSDPLTPVATVIEGGSDLKGLLTEGIEPEDGTLPRQWSLWRTTDPVSLQQGQVVPGSAEFACHYANNVFVFQSEENLKAFVADPRRYLAAAPEMPPDYRIMMTGPRGSGFHTQAKKLEELYGWRVVDFPKIVKAKLEEIMAMPTKLPNNVTDEGPCMVSMSEEELQQIRDGKFIPSWKFLPWVLEYLGVPLMQRPPAPPGEVVEPNVEEMTDEERKAYEKEQKKKAEEKKKKDKEE